MDNLDRAQKETDLLQLRQLQAVREKASHREVEATGFCLNCGEEVEPGRRWCCADCRDEWELRKKRGQ